jgi:hypothetical protein
VIQYGHPFLSRLSRDELAEPSKSAEPTSSSASRLAWTFRARHTFGCVRSFWRIGTDGEVYWLVRAAR